MYEIKGFINLSSVYIHIYILCVLSYHEMVLQKEDYRQWTLILYHEPFPIESNVYLNSDD